MSRKRSTTACTLVSLALVMSMLAGCGPSGCSSTGGNDSSTTQTASMTDAKTVEGTLLKFDGKTLVIDCDGTAYTLDLSKASIKSTELHDGDTLIITYRGELKAGDPTACTVISVETKDDKDEDVNQIVGTLEDITMNAITIRTIDGRMLTFNANNVKHSFSYGIDKGNWVTVVYHGDLIGTDTSNIAVVEIHDEDTDYVKMIKAQTKIIDADETMYALENAQVRSSYMMASEQVGTLKARESVKVTGRCNNGWDRVTYDGHEAYVYGSMLTASSNESASKGSTDISQKVQIKALNETVYAKSDANVREGYSTSSKSIGALKAGTSVTRTGICDNGWSRINYNGRAAFVYSDLLTTKNPNSDVDGVKVTAVNETVYVVTDANVRKSASSSSEQLGTLKAGEKAFRTGICNNGWSRITYNKQDAYISSNLITKTDPNKTKTVTIYKSTGYAWTTCEANVRESYSAQSTSLGKLAKGARVTVTGVTDNSWTRISYKGKVGFVHNDLLTSKNPKPSNVASSSTIKAEDAAKKAEEERKAKEAATKKAAEEEEAAKKAEEEAAKKAEEEKKAKEDAAKKAEEEKKAQEEDAKKAEEEAAKKAEEEAAAKAAEEEAAKKAEEEAAKKAAEEAEAAKKAEEEAKKAAEEAEAEAAKEAEEQQQETDGDSQDQGDDQETEGDSQEQGDDQETEGDSQEQGDDQEAVEQWNIEGIVVGYSLESITIEVEGGSSSATSANSDSSGSQSSDEYPSMTYDQASGTVTTYYTFDIRGASQKYTKGVAEGLTVRVTYEGNLNDMSTVHATNITDVGVENRSCTYSGIVTTCTGNTVTVLVENGVENTFSFENVDVDKDKLLPGAEVKIIADLKGAKLKDNVFKAVKIEIVKEAEPEAAAEAKNDDQAAADDNANADSESEAEPEAEEEPVPEEDAADEEDVVDEDMPEDEAYDDEVMEE